LFNELESEDFLTILSNITGYKLLLDPTRNFWGVHKYKNGDKLDVHVDAGLHPLTKQKKQVTFGIYLSNDWKEEYGFNLDIWEGDNSSFNNAKIYKKVDSISPIFNRMIMFTCNDYSWHGISDSIFQDDPNSYNAKRIFITISYLSENYEDKNKRHKAFFVAKPGDEPDTYKDNLRILRSDPNRYKEFYRI
jgi:Rps23 Pro-64 3,4-dihydroxylase Tpa1-like proline 4-hydroxylase